MHRIYPICQKVNNLFCGISNPCLLHSIRVIPESIYGNPDGDGRIVIFDEEITEGDLNSDGKIDITDYALIKSVYFEKYIPNKNERALSDVNDDGKINVFDMILVKQIYFAA